MPEPRRFNWPLWSGLALSVVAFLAYPFFFVRYPITRDVPWASYLLFVAAFALLVMGVRRAARKRVGWVVAGVSVAIALLFVVIIEATARQLPASREAIAVGAKAPQFTLLDTNRRPVALAQLAASPGTRGVLLIFYRGYW